MTVHYSRNAQEEIERYYERYQSRFESGYQQPDLEQRADNYRKIANTLRYLENYLDQTYVKNNRKFINHREYCYC